MTDEQQRTLAEAAPCRGVGLFTGEPATLTFRPAPAGTGLVFRRTDLEGSPHIPARVEFVSQRPRRTALQNGGASVETVEHCLSALVGMGIDNAFLDLSGPEVPAGDGSASMFIDVLRAAGVAEQDAPREPLIVQEPVVVRDGDATIAALPTECAGMDSMYVLDYGPDSPIPRQIHRFTIDGAGDGAYEREIAPARTFSTESDALAAWGRGLFKHLTAKDMLVIGSGGPIENAYRFEDEPVRHKLLDLIGDLALVGRRIRGRVVAVRSGHALNHRLAKELLEAERRQETDLVGAGAPAMDIRSILRLLPHRYPMILIDRVLEIDADRRAVGVKNVTINEPFFQGHYPAAPIMPGVLIVEAMCQLAGLMLSHKLERTGKIAMLLSLDHVKLRRPVTPGDQLVLETESIRASSRFGDVQCRAFVSGQLVAEARVKFMMVDAEQAG